MSTLTTNYNLTKPDYADSADIMDINGNMDILDDVVKEVSDKTNENTSDVSTLQTDVGTLQTDVSALQTAVQGKQDSTDNNLTTTNKNIVGAINEVNSKFVVEQKASSSFTPSGSNVSINIAKEGYTPIGIMGITGSNTSIMTYYEWYIESATTAKVYFRSSSTSYQVTLRLNILYMKN